MWNKCCTHCYELFCIARRIDSTRFHSARSKLSTTLRTLPSLLISKDTLYVCSDDSVRESASREIVEGEHLFLGCEARASRYLRNTPLCKLLSIRECFFLFYIPYLPVVIGNHWIHDRFADEGEEEGGRTSARSLEWIKKAIGAGARCKFITRVCRAFVRTRLFVESNQILSNTHSRYFFIKVLSSKLVEKCDDFVVYDYAFSIVNIQYTLVYISLYINDYILTNWLFENKDIAFFNAQIWVPKNKIILISITCYQIEIMRYKIGL